MQQSFLEALADRVLVCDGAVGTMLYAKGVFINKSFDALNVTSPELVGEVHEEYLRAGADIIETNTFGANRTKLGSFGLGDRLRAINVQGARIARAAAAGRAYVAGSIGPLGHPHRAVGKDRCRRGARRIRGTGAGARRRRRRPVHSGDVPRPERNWRRHRRRPPGLGPADRRADDHRGRREHARRDATRAVRARPRAAWRHLARRQLRGRAGADARHHRADGRRHEAEALGPAQRRAPARRRGAQSLPVLAGVHGIVRAALHPAQRARGRRVLRHDARAHPADQVGGSERQGTGLRTGTGRRPVPRTRPSAAGSRRTTGPRAPAGRAATRPSSPKCRRFRARTSHASRTRSLEVVSPSPSR